MHGNTPSPFGQKPTTPGFGTGLSQPTFGSPGASAFGTPQQPTFGQAPGTAFGQSNPATAFGQTSNPAFGQPANTQVFGQAPGFGAPTNQPSFGATSTGQPTFGATTTGQPTFGATTTGQPTFGVTPTGQPTFGATPAAQPTFGATPAAQPTFGATPGAQPTFGAPSNQPTFGAPSTQLTFGAPAATPGFGAPASTPGFGASATPAFGTAPASAAPAFGTAATPAFGAATTPAFGAPSTATPAFGTPTTTPAFGNTTPSLTLATNTQQKPAFGAATTQSSLSFGTGAATTTVTTQPSGFQFGTNLGQAGFGTAVTTTATPALGAATTQPSLTFPAPQTSGLTFGTKPGAISFSSPATTTQSSITFGTSLTPKPSTTQGSTGFSFGTLGSTPAVTATTTQTTIPTIGLSNFTTTGPSLGSVIGGKSMLTITGNTATPLYSTKTADLQAGRSAGQIPPKCQNVHPSVMELVESFKNNMKEQKHLCLEVSRASLKPISKISNDAENIKRSVMKLERAVNKNKLLNSKLKEETIKALADVEVAQKAMDIPGGFPSDNSIITDYFVQLANKFQQQVLALRVELESTEKSILCELNPVPFTPQELSTTMQRLYECFVALAGRFQFVHAQISNLKVQHLELRRKNLEDYTDIFSKKNLVPSIKPPIHVSQPMGPSPFSGIRSINSVMSSLGYPLNDASSSFSLPNTNTLNISGFGSLNQSLQNNNLLSSPQQSAPGSKRGKR